MRPRLLDLPPGVLLDDSDRALFAGRSIYIGANGYAYVSNHSEGPRTVHSILVGSTPGMHVDHINGLKLDNRRANLRVVTPQTNQVNRKRLNRNNKSGVRGVAHVPHMSSRNPWRAQITVNRRNYHLGLFTTLDLAIAARRAAEIRFYGEACP